MAISPDNPKSTKSDETPFLKLYLPALVLFLLLGSLVGSGFVYLLAEITGVALQDLLTQEADTFTKADLRFFRVMVVINHLFTFLLPSVAFAVLFWKEKAWSYLKLDHWPPQRMNLYAIIWLLSAFPLSYALYWLNQQMPLPEWMSSMEMQAQAMLKQLLYMDSIGDLLISLFIMAVMPALGEELLFRGLFQNILERSWKKPVLAILAAAFVFSAFHLQFEGFLPRFFLGILLGYLFYWSQNLWVPIVAHFFYNGIQVFGYYMQGEQSEFLQMEKAGPAPGWWLIVAVAIFLVITGIVYKNRTHA